MLLFEDRKCVFIHIPKTGGTSLQELLGPYANHRSRSWAAIIARRMTRNRDRWPWLNLNNRTHLSYLRMAASNFPDNILNNYKIYCTARNPIAWQYSTYRHFLRHHQKGGYANQFPDGVLDTFEQYLQYRLEIGPLGQVAMLADQAGNLHCDHFMRLEHIDEELTEFLSLLGLPDEAKLRKSNADNQSPPQVWSENAKAICYEAFTDDYEFFGYTRDGKLLPKPRINGKSVSKSLHDRIGEINPHTYDPWKLEILSPRSKHAD